jgi:hypothetical protein
MSQRTPLFFTLEAADSVVHDLLIAVLLVVFVMLFFLHSIRNSNCHGVYSGTTNRNIYWDISIGLYF